MPKGKYKALSKPSLVAKQDSTNPRNMYKSSPSSGKGGFDDLKRTSKAATAGLSLLKASPVPQLAAVGWGASAISAGMGVSDAYDNSKKGNYKQAGLDVVGAGLDLIPLRAASLNTRPGGIINLAKKLTTTQKIGNFGVGAAQGAALANDVNDIKEAVEYEKGTKSMKTNYKPKIKKAFNGLNDVAVPEAGSGTDVLSASVNGAMTGAGIGGPAGALIGGVAGFGMGLINKNAQDEANTKALKANAYAKNSRGYAGVESTINQKYQVMKKGGKTNTKMIEIEGKGTPEIHTDKHFNVKNLGTTPHSKGGNKVEASEGDVVFNTQNSLTKYNKIAAAIQSGDKATLIKEKNRLPEDGGNKNAGGNKGVKPPRKIKPVMYQGKPLPFDAMNRNGKYGKADAAFNGLKDGSSTLVPANQAGRRKLIFPYATVDNSEGTQYKDTRATPQIANPAVLANTQTPTSTFPTSLSTIPQTSTIGNPDYGKVKTDKEVAKDAGGSNLLQYAGVANNLIQGLKPEKPIDQSYMNPQLLKYTDRSERTRTQSSEQMMVDNKNARNLSGGNAGNLRANMQVANASNYGRQDNINEKEMGRADAVDNENVGIQNQARQYNLQRKDMYQGQMMDQRLLKQQYMDQAASEIGQIGMANREEKYMRDKDDKQNAMQLAAWNAIGTKDFNRNLDGTQKTALTSAPVTPFATPTSAFPTTTTTPFNPQTLYTSKPTKVKAATTLTPTTTTKRKR